jgi:hypothetical protein
MASDSGVWNDVLLPSNSLVGLTVDPCGRGERGVRPAGGLTDGPRDWRVLLPGPGLVLPLAGGAGDVEGLGLDMFSGEQERQIGVCLGDDLVWKGVENSGLIRSLPINEALGQQTIASPTSSVE